MKPKIILDLCGGTGAWSKPYARAGYDVINVTLPVHDVRTYLPSDKVHGILAAPPCTMFSLARTRAKKPRDFDEGMVLVMACLHIIWECRIKNKLAFWVLENPMGYLRQFLGKPAMTFDPCEFGDPYTKKTDLWGYFKEPKRTPTSLTKQQKARCKINNRTLPKGKSIATRRAITPKHFAQAFFEANQ